ncbi:hypothetical protein D1AOALGA4SA_8546 [Olavius algarvensis Delta 1 endosymbiont]|nr:hypothetical protein D1AOALGA4SA_8546 [Olavius algarvensis Delta 1 endosymbiont]
MSFETNIRFQVSGFGFREFSRRRTIRHLLCFTRALSPAKGQPD